MTLLNWLDDQDHFLGALFVGWLIYEAIKGWILAARGKK